MFICTINFYRNSYKYAASMLATWRVLLEPPDHLICNTLLSALLFTIFRSNTYVSVYQYHRVCLSSGRSWVRLFVFYVPSTARSFRYGTPIFCPLRRTGTWVNTPFLPGIEPRGIAWQSITLPLRHASSTLGSCRVIPKNIIKMAQSASLVGTQALGYT